MGKLKLSKFYFFMIGIMIVVLGFSVTAVYSLSFSSTMDGIIDDYFENAAEYTGGMSDDSLLSLFKEAKRGLDLGYQEALDSFSDEEIIDLARGTEAGMELVDEMSADQIEAFVLVGQTMHEINYKYPVRELSTRLASSYGGASLLGSCDPCQKQGITDGCTNGGKGRCVDGVYTACPAGEVCTEDSNGDGVCDVTNS